MVSDVDLVPSDTKTEIETKLTPEQEGNQIIKEALLTEFPNLFRRIDLTDGTDAAVMVEYHDPTSNFHYPTAVFSVHGRLSFMGVKDPDPEGITKLLHHTITNEPYDNTQIFKNGTVPRHTVHFEPQGWADKDEEFLDAWGKGFAILDQQIKEQQRENNTGEETPQQKAQKAVKYLKSGASKINQPS